jgi:hypothetical protein
MYMSLPTEKLTVLLSQHRLAPTQIVFGVGHPMTSGSLAIDYTILSQTMMPDPPYNVHPLTEVSSSESSFGMHCATQIHSYFSRHNLSIASLQSQRDYGGTLIVILLLTLSQIISMPILLLAAHQLDLTGTLTMSKSSFLTLQDTSSKTLTPSTPPYTRDIRPQDQVPTPRSVPNYSFSFLHLPSYSGSGEWHCDRLRGLQ